MDPLHYQLLQDARTHDASKAKALQKGIYLSLEASHLKIFNPEPLLQYVLYECPELQSCKSEIYTIIAELYNNSLDHGILKMDSALKTSATGMMQYYEIRQERLSDLLHGSITIDIQYTEEGLVVIKISDTGDGFNHAHINYTIKNIEGFFGRGLPLVKALAHTLHFNEKGNSVVASYKMAP